MALPLLLGDELVAVAWLSSIPALTPPLTGGQPMVGTTLPPDATSQGPAAWLKTGYVTVAVVGGNPDDLLPVSRAVVQVDCWAALPGSNLPPWQMATAIASVITRATWDRRTINRRLDITVNGVTYPSASVHGARLMTAWRRLYDDNADYARVTADLWLQWVQVSEQIA